MVENFKYFLLHLDRLIAVSFAYCQSRTSDIIIDTTHSWIRRLSPNYKPTTGNAEIKEAKKLVDLLQMHGKDRGYLTNASHSATLDKLPIVLRNIINKHYLEIALYLGESFTVDNTIIWRDYEIPVSLSGYDIYSNVWHQDSHDGNRLLKVFVNVENVTLEDGPIKWLCKNSTRKFWNKLRDRWGWHIFKGIDSFDVEQSLVGAPGTYAILDTSRLLHRASIPKESRATLQVTLYPYWRGKKKNLARFNTL